MGEGGGFATVCPLDEGDFDEGDDREGGGMTAPAVTWFPDAPLMPCMTSLLPFDPMLHGKKHAFRKEVEMTGKALDPWFAWKDL